MMARFVFTYRGGRPSGLVCNEDHEYLPPIAAGGVGYYAHSTGGGHNETDGYPSDCSDEELEDEFLRWEHIEIGHNATTACPLCRRWRSDEL